MKSVSSGKTRGSRSRHQKKKEKEKIRKISKAFRETKKTSIETITKRIRAYHINTD